MSTAWQKYDDQYSVSLTYSSKYQVAYSPSNKRIFIYWFVDEEMHCLAENSDHQVAWTDEIDFDQLLLLGDL